MKEKNSTIEKLESSKAATVEDLSAQLQAASEASKNKQNKIEEVNHRVLRALVYPVSEKSLCGSCVSFEERDAGHCALFAAVTRS